MGRSEAGSVACCEVAEDVCGGGFEIGEDEAISGEGLEGFRGVFLGAGLEEDGATASVEAGKGIGDEVTDHPGTGEVEEEVGRGLEEHAWFGLAIGRAARGFGFGGGSIGAEIDRIELGAMGCELAVHLFMNLVQAIDGIQTAADAGLVGDDDDGEAGGAELTDGERSAWEEGDLSRVGEVVDMFEDGAVTIQKHGWTGCAWNGAVDRRGSHGLQRIPGGGGGVTSGEQRG